MINLSEDIHFKAISGATPSVAIEAIKATFSKIQEPDASPEFTQSLPILLLRKNDETSKRALAKRVHDIRGALRTLSLAVGSIKEGYKFDDSMAEAKLNAMLKAIAILDRESQSSVALMSTF